MKVGVDQRRQSVLVNLAARLKVAFSDYSLLHQALTHTSFANESRDASVRHNERLEFLGDAVLDLAVGDYLYRQFPAMPEGELTKARARIVCEPTLAACANKLGIGEYLLLGKGELITGGRQRISILADAFEAIIGAIYLDSGYANATQFVVAHLANELALVESGDYVSDYKTSLQEVIQRNGDKRIAYEVVDERGPDHEKMFVVTVSISGENFGIGYGKSKKEAEQQAAREALKKLNIIKD